MIGYAINDNLLFICSLLPFINRGPKGEPGYPGLPGRKGRNIGATSHIVNMVNYEGGYDAVSTDTQRLRNTLTKVKPKVDLWKEFIENIRIPGKVYVRATDCAVIACYLNHNNCYSEILSFFLVPGLQMNKFLKTVLLLYIDY